MQHTIMEKHDNHEEGCITLRRKYNIQDVDRHKALDRLKQRGIKIALKCVFDTYIT